MGAFKLELRWDEGDELNPRPKKNTNGFTQLLVVGGGGLFFGAVPIAFATSSCLQIFHPPPPLPQKPQKVGLKWGGSRGVGTKN